MKGTIIKTETMPGDDMFLTWLAREAGSDMHRKTRQNTEEGPHPTDEMLYGYVWNDLDVQDARLVKAHITFCRICAEEVFRLHLIEEATEKNVDRWINGGESSMAAPQNLLDDLALEFWEPDWQQQRATASDIPPQQHLFARGDGDITISCLWRSQHRRNPSYISISWKADVTTYNEIHARFVDPETRQQLAEVRLGAAVIGEEVFTSDELGFDPSSERWALALVVKEVPA
jgi:hypothetical protein